MNGTHRNRRSDKSTLHITDLLERADHSCAALSTLAIIGATICRSTAAAEAVPIGAVPELLFDECARQLELSGCVGGPIH